MFISQEKGSNKNRPCANRNGLVHIRRYAIELPTQKYCIIFGAASQAEHSFLAGCYFYTHF